MTFRKATILLGLFLSLISIHGLRASTWGLSLGGGLSMSIPRAETPWPSTYYCSAPGLSLGLSAEYSTAPWFSASLGIRYAYKGYLYFHSYQSIPTDVQIIGDSVLEIPAMLHFTFTEGKYRPGVGIGGYIGWRLHRGALGFSDNPSVAANGWTSRGDVLFFDTISYSREDERFVAGVSAELFLDSMKVKGDKFRYSIRYDAALISLYKAGCQRKIYHHYVDSLTFSVSYIWDFSKEENK